MKGEKVSVRMYRQNWQHLLSLLEQQGDMKSRQIVERIKYEILQEDIRGTKRQEAAR